MATEKKAPLSEERLREIRERANVANSGPWWFDGGAIYGPTENGGEVIIGARTFVSFVGGADGGGSEHDGRFMAAAREDVPDLLDEVERLRTENEALKADAKQARNAVLQAGRDPKWAAVYAWLDDNKDAVVKQIADNNGKLEREVVALRARVDELQRKGG